MTRANPAGMDIGFDADRGLLLCRVRGPLLDCEATDLSRRLTDAIVEARRHGPLRVLWDNRATVPLGPELTDLFRTLLVERGEPEDRLAIIVANSLEKARSRPQTANGHQLFASENAALTWLSVGTSSAAA